MMNFWQICNSHHIALHGILLLAIAWPGPRPVTHAHADVVRGGEIARLIDHIALSHSATNTSLPEPNTRHIHWVIYSGGLSDPGLFPTANTTCFVTATNVDPTHHHLAIQRPNQLAAPIAIRPPQTWELARRHFSPAQASSDTRTALSLLCVWTC